MDSSWSGQEQLYSFLLPSGQLETLAVVGRGVGQGEELPLSPEGKGQGELLPDLPAAAPMVSLIERVCVCASAPQLDPPVPKAEYEFYS